MIDWSRFNIKLEEPAGRYGIAGGQVIADAFNNPVGTTYIDGCEDPYDPSCIDTLGDGTITADADTGTVLIKNLAPGKYGIVVDPPADEGWQQTSTIEGTKTIDAWVKANEPPFFVEFGFPGPHVFMGFTKPIDNLPEGGTATISGLITDMHMSRPPTFQFFSGRPFPSCWVALNEGGAVLGEAYYAAPCAPDSTFEIAGVPDGSYSLTIWDSNLDVVIAQQPITVAGGACNGGDCDLGEVAVFNWFTRLNTAMFLDTNQNGFRDDNELPAPSERGPIQLRWRDGTIYQAFGTDTEGLAPFDEVFPFFHWLVAEVGFTRDKITGATFVVDAGGEVDTSTDEFPGFGELTPQPQLCTEAQSTDPDDPDFGCTLGEPLINPNTGDNLSRTVTGPVLTQAFQGFLGQTSVMQFGTAPYLQFLPGFPPALVGENGGISGMVLYATTRAEDDPELAVAEEWEPGVPRVQVALYADGDIDNLDFPFVAFPGGEIDIDWDGDGLYDPNDGVIDDVNMNGEIDLADVDNYPLGNFPGAEDIDRNGNGSFDYGDAINVTWTDSWDDSLPTGCQGLNSVPDVSVIDPPVTDDRCFDGLRNFNQVRPGVFDGGWAFDRYDLAALDLAGRSALADKLEAFYADRIVSAATLPDAWMIPGEYIVEAATPPGYKALREHHKNVDFGDEYTTSLQAPPPVCVGDAEVVPPYLAIATKDGSGAEDQLIAGIDPAEVEAPFAGEARDMCDRKLVQLSNGQNAAADFFVMTDVPIAGNVSGMILNDLANEFNPNSPAFGEKYAPPFVPVGFYDWNGDEVNRIYADQYGRFNALLPSTWTANLPQPSGMSPNMIVSCMNDAGPIPNPEFATNPDAPEFILDPFYDPRFSQFCYTFQYMPGAITYLDTPVESIAAFANPAEFPVDCERPDRTPMVSQVERANVSGGGGPFVVGAGTVSEPQQIVIRSLGREYLVPNPEWDGVTQSERFITRNYNFGGRGNPGTVELEDADGNRTALNILDWRPTRIRAEVPVEQTPGDYQVVVTRVGGVPEPVESPIGVTLTVGICLSGGDVEDLPATCEGTEYGVRPNADFLDEYAEELGDFLEELASELDEDEIDWGDIQELYEDLFEEVAGIIEEDLDLDDLYAIHSVGEGGDFTLIQDAIDAAGLGDLILVAPGIYEELVIMWKPVKLQGWGAGAVTLNARQSPTETLAEWREKIEGLVLGGLVDLLPGQELPLAGFPALGAPIFATEEGAGIFVVGRDSWPQGFRGAPNRGSRIDGFTIVGASQGGAITANGYTGDLNIGNNRLTGNAGFFGGGIRIGHPTLVAEIDNDLVYPDAWNDRIRIHHNHIAQNGNTFGGAGAGISLHTGADRYRVQENWVCGNFSQGDGAGIAHFGLSDRGLIEDNLVLFNESFQQAGPVNGSGIFVGGKPALQPAPNTGLLLSPGSGRVTIDANIIRGNLAGAGDGGGIHISQPNGLDIDASLDNTGPWYDVLVYNNMITNNVAGLAGGGISAQDAVSVTIRHNTVANNDSTATTALAFDPTLDLNQGGNNVTTPQPAGIAGRYHSLEFAAVMQEVTDAVDPELLIYSLDGPSTLVSNIVYQNRSFYWTNFDDPETAVIETGLVPASCQDPTDPLNDPTCDITIVPVEEYTNDLGVLNGITETLDLLDPRRTLLTDTFDNQSYIGSFSNITGDPAFVNPYFNGSRDSLTIAEFKTLQTAGAFDEGGNFIQVTFGPLSIVDYTAGGRDLANLFDYHITSASDAIDEAGPVSPSLALLRVDFDDEPRPQGEEADMGADELQ